MNFSLSDKERAFGERLRADAWRAIKETDARTRNRQNDVTKKLGRFELCIVLDNLYYSNERYSNRFCLQIV